MGLALIAAASEPVATAAEAAKQCRCEEMLEDEENILNALVAAATDRAEAFTNRRFVTQRWRLTLDAFSGALRLPYPPLVSVQSVKYIDGNGVLQTLANTEYTVRTAPTVGEIVLAYGKSWPSYRSVADALQIEFTAGYGAPAAVPAGIKQAVLMIAATLYAHRENVNVGNIVNEMPQAAEWLLAPYRVIRFAA